MKKRATSVIAMFAMIASISSWAAAVSEYTKGTGMNGFELFVKAIPYNFYSLLTFVFIIVLVLSKRDFGPMAKHEKNALEKGDLFSTEERVNGSENETNAKGRVLDLVLPILLLIAVSVYALIYNGGFFNADSTNHHSYLCHRIKKYYIYLIAIRFSIWVCPRVWQVRYAVTIVPRSATPQLCPRPEPNVSM